MQQTVATDSQAGWVFVVDNLNTHCSESLVQWVAELEGTPDDLGEKGKRGILHNTGSRSALGADPGSASPSVAAGPSQPQTVRPIRNLRRRTAAGVRKRELHPSAFLSSPTHRVRFVYTPEHCSCLNQVQIWVSILSRRALRRTSFASLDELATRLRELIVCFNRILAKPFRWTYKGRPLAA